MMTVKMMSYKTLWHNQSCKIFGTQVGHLIRSESCAMRTFCTLLSVHMINTIQKMWRILGRMKMGSDCLQLISLVTHTYTCTHTKCG